jgi:hypothetical protein
MNLLRTVIRPYLVARYNFHRLTATGAFRREGARTVDPTALPSWNPLKQAIWKYHVKQFHESSCSVASVVSCINALRALEKGNLDPISQREILDRWQPATGKRACNSCFRGACQFRSDYLLNGITLPTFIFAPSATLSIFVRKSNLTFCAVKSFVTRNWSNWGLKYCPIFLVIRRFTNLDK